MSVVYSKLVPEEQLEGANELKTLTSKNALVPEVHCFNVKPSPLFDVGRSVGEFFAT